MNGVYSILEYEFNTLFSILKKKTSFFLQNHTLQREIGFV